MSLKSGSPVQPRLDLDDVAPTATRTVPVLVPLAVNEAYDYALAANDAPPPGSFVRVPLGSAQRIGVVWDQARHTDISARRLRSIIEVLDAPALPAVSRNLVEWVASYTLSPRGMVLKMMMSAPRAFEPEGPQFGFRASGPPPERMTAARRKVLDAAADGAVRSKAALAREAGVSAAVIDGLAAAGALVRVEMPGWRPRHPDPDHAPPELAPEQAEAAGKLVAAMGKGGFSVSLLDGVTGAGKTEVYFEAVAAALAEGKQVLILLPEIALTSQFLDRFAGRFGCRPMEWHSALGAAERGRTWQAIATGEARAVAGARSALFLPFPDLGLIVVDEEHEQSFKQEDYVRYQARDVAVVRGSLGRHPVILSSATPSIESVVNAQQGRYQHVRLTSRYAGAALPDIRAIDLRADPPERGHWLSPPLVSAVRDTLAADKQALLFLNRRGYAPLTLCRACGHRIECPQCSATLVEHRARGKLTCHHCGFVLPRPGDCPACGVSGKLVPCGPGVERVAEEVAERFPGVPAAILSSDFTTNLTQVRETIARISSGEARIVVGTQLVAKGHHFPGLSLVGVVDGDLSLAQGGDPRAAERTFQLMQQVIGRAGREDSGGIGLIQTHAPEHPVMRALISGDRDTFLAREIAAREEAGLPPFGRLAAIIVSAGAKPEAERYAQALARAAPDAPRITVMGPAEAPLALIRGRHRYRLLVKAPREIDLQGFLRLWMDRAPPAKGSMRTVIDVDPYSFL
ncbi:MAG: primosomal protein N' [Dichotomicrobium sp.]